MGEPGMFSFHLFISTSSALDYCAPIMNLLYFPTRLTYDGTGVVVSVCNLDQETSAALEAFRLMMQDKGLSYGAMRKVLTENSYSRKVLEVLLT